MWVHAFQCKKCSAKIEMETESMLNPMRDRVGLHSSLYGDGASSYYHGATIRLLTKQGTLCQGTLTYLLNELKQVTVRPTQVYDANAKVTEGELGKVTEDVWKALPSELQKKLVNVLSSTAPPHGGQGIKALSGRPQYKGVTYTYELKFLGHFGDHRCYGNKQGAKVEFTVYDPSGSLH